MKKFAAVIAITVACTTSAFAQGYAPQYAPQYAPAACAPAPVACAPVSCGSPCINPLAPVVGVVQGVGALIGSTVNGFASLFGCNPC